MNREKVDRYLERGILAAVVLILCWTPVYLGGATPTGFLAVEGLTLLAAVLWLARLWLKHEPHLLWPTIVWPVLAFVAYALIRYLNAPVEYVARQEFLRVVVYGLLFLITLTNLYRQESIQTIVAVLIAVGTAIAAYAGYQYLTESSKVLWFESPYTGRASGTYYSPNHLAGFLEMVLPLAIAFVFAGRQSATVKVLFGYAAAVMLAGIGVTLSRGGWVACGVGLLVLCTVLAWHRIYRIPALVLIALLVLAGVFFYSKHVGAQIRVERTVETFVLDRDARVQIWKSAVSMWRDHPWFGVGPGHFDQRYRQYRTPLVQMRPGWVHNDYLNALVDWGVVGTGIILVWCVVLVLTLRRMWRFVVKRGDDFSHPSSNRFAYATGATAALVAILIHSYVDFNMHVPANAIVMSVISALLAAHIRFATEKYWIGLTRASRFGLTLLLAACCGYLATQLVRGAREQYWLVKAARAPLHSAVQTEALIAAYHIEPNNPQTTYSIGEAYRVQAMNDTDASESYMREAMTWFRRGIALNPFDPHNYFRYGMCLDWLEETREAEPYFLKAAELDPFGYFTIAHVGWHFIQTGDLPAARTWLERARRLMPNKSINTIAYTYLALVQQRMAEHALKFKPRD